MVTTRHRCKASLSSSRLIGRLLPDYHNRLAAYQEREKCVFLLGAEAVEKNLGRRMPESAVREELEALGILEV